MPERRTVNIVPESYPLSTPKGVEDARRELGRLDFQNNLVGLDIETAPLFPFRENKLAGLDRYMSEIRLVQMFDGKLVVVFDLRQEGVKSLILEHFRLNNYNYIAHNAMFELKHLSSLAGYMPEIGCTQIMDRLVFMATQAVGDNMKKDERADLATCCKRWLGIEVDKEQQKSDWSLEELSAEQIEYAAKDAILTRILAYKLWPKLTKLELTNVYKLNRAAQRPIVSMMLNGFAFDNEKHDNLIRTWESHRDDLEETIRMLLGDDNVSLTSPKQMSELIRNTMSPKIVARWPKTPSEKNDYLSLNKNDLDSMKDVPFVSKFIEYKKACHSINQFGKPFKQYINPVTDRLHCGGFTLSETKTGRLSSRQPNFQNLPRPSDKDTISMRDCFVAAPGKVLVAADYSQIELRVAGQLSGDAVMLHAFENNIDLHLRIAEIMNGASEYSFTKETHPEERQSGKIFNYSLLFGAGAKSTARRAKLEYGVDMSVDEAQRGVEAFRTLYPQYYQWQLMTHMEASRKLVSTTPTGKLRKLDEKGYYTRSMNHPIQGAAGELILFALNKLYKELQGGAKIVNCVHDEIILEVEEKLAAWALETLESSMLWAWETIFPGACSRKLVEGKIGYSWSEVK